MCSSLYKVGGHVFSVIFEDEALSAELLPLMGNYVPFQVADNSAETVFDLKVVADTAGSVGGLSLLDYEIDIRQEEEGLSIDCGHTADGCSVFVFKFGDKLSGRLICSKDYRQAELRLASAFRKAGVDNA